MSVRNWAGKCAAAFPGQWQTGYSGLASSTDGGKFTRSELRFPNDPSNLDPFQMQTMELDGDYVYLFSVRAGRQNGPMMLQRVRSTSIFDRSAYQCWSGNAWGTSCTSILPETDFGEPSVRKLGCTWAMSYLAGGAIVTRMASRPEGPWSDPHVQVTGGDQPCLYGGFIHPSSTPDDLHLMVSAWGDAGSGCGQGGKYGVDHFVGKL